MQVRIVVTRPEGTPLQGVELEVISTDTLLRQGPVYRTDNGGEVIATTTGPFFVKPRVTGDRHRVLVTTFGNAPCYDYVVDVDGNGTHTTIQAAWDEIKNTTGDKSVFLCPGDVGPLFVDADNGLDAVIHWVGQRNALIKGTFTNPNGYRDISSSGEDNKRFIFEGVTFDEYNPGSSYAIKRDEVTYTRDLELLNVACKGPVKNHGPIRARGCSFEGTNIAHAYDGDGNIHSSWFWNNVFDGSIRPGSEEYFHHNTTVSGVACVGNIGVHGTSGGDVHFDGHIFRSGTSFAYIKYFEIGASSSISIKNSEAVTDLHQSAGVAAVHINSGYSFDGTSAQITNNKWECGALPGLLIESGDVNELIYEGNSHGNTAPGYVAVQTAGAGFCTQSTFGPNSPADLVYNVAGSGNIFYPGASIGIPGSGVGGASTSEPFVTIGNPTTLSAERSLAAGTGLALVDGGPNAAVTLSVQDIFVKKPLVVYISFVNAPETGITISP